MAELLRLEGVSKYYSSSQSVVMGLNNISLSLHRGEFVAVTGESGSGKSTLAHVLGGILPYESGEMYFCGRPTSHFDSADYERYRRDCVSFISQSYGILAGCSVLENVVGALRLAGMERHSARGKAEDILRQVELWELRHRKAGKLSSGQKQRLAIARALAKPAPILIADEPTGNLDAENSAKVISLLAQAAKERLVILITHEFSEAEDYVTRRIDIHDGQIALDTALRPTAEAKVPAGAGKEKGQRLSSYVARLQLGGRPVWSALVLGFFALTAFAVFALLGTFIIELDDTDTRVYDSAAFANGDRERIVAVRSDGQSMTEDDYAAILSVEYVESLDKWGYAADINYAYREGTDYRYKYSSQSGGTLDDDTRFVHSSIKLLDSMPFIQTVPLLSGDWEFLSAGRYPENIFQVVLAGDESRIGETFPVFIHDSKNWSSSCMIQLQVEVVGVTGYGSGLYFHSDIGRAFNDHFITGDHEYLLLYAADLADDMFRPGQQLYTLRLRRENYSFHPYDYTAPIITGEGEKAYGHLELKMICEANGNMAENLEPTHSSFLYGYIEVSQSTFYKITNTEPCDQVSVTISDYAYTDRVLEALRGEGYIAISPFREGSTKQSPTLAAEREQTLSICAIALLAVLLLQVIVLRALFSAQTESYVLLSNMGLVCPVAKRSVWWQLLLFTILGQALGFGALALCGSLGIERIVAIMRYLPAEFMLLLSAVHLLAACIAAWWVSHALTRQVFPLSAAKSDLRLEDEEVAA